MTITLLSYTDMCYIGSSGYSYAFWGDSPRYPGMIRNFYPAIPATRWLPYYAERFNSVEINCTRYRRLTPAMCTKWARQVPAHFRFTIKVGLYFTHNKKLNDPNEWWADMEPCIDALGDKFVALLFQFHPSFVCSEANIAKLDRVQQLVSQNVDCALEFRHPSWFDKDTATLPVFQRPNWAVAQLHLPEVRGRDASFGQLAGGCHRLDVNNRFAYVRFHGTTDYSCGTYGYKQLVPIVDEVHDRGYAKVCFYFNNTDTWEPVPDSHVSTPDRPCYWQYAPLLHTPYHVVTVGGIPIQPSALHDCFCVQQRILDLEQQGGSYDSDGYRRVEIV